MALLGHKVEVSIKSVAELLIPLSCNIIVLLQDVAIERSPLVIPLKNQDLSNTSGTLAETCISGKHLFVNLYHELLYGNAVWQEDKTY